MLKLVYYSPFPLSDSVVLAGLLPVVVALLEQRQAVAQKALHILKRLCCMDIDPWHHHADLLASLQGTRRLSILLFSAHASTRPVNATGMAVKASCCDWCVTLCCCLFMPLLVNTMHT